MHYHCAIASALLGIIYFIYKLWIGFIFWTTLLLMYPFFWVLLMRKQWYPAAFTLKRLWSMAFKVLLFCPVKAKFMSKLPPPPYIIVSNHSSYLDTVFMYSIFPDYFLFIGKGELLKWPLFRLFFRKMDIPVTRDNSKMAYNALQKAYDAIDEGACIAIYPEGTIPHSAPRMKVFKKGAFRMAIDKKVPIVPMTWVNNYKVLKDPAKLFEFSLPRRIDVVVHNAIQTDKLEDGDLVKLTKLVYDTIDSALEPKYQSSK